MKSTHKLPDDSVLHIDNINYHYMDSYTATFEDKNDTITLEVVGKSFFKSGPSWIGRLFALRNKIVSLFGLKIPETSQDHQKQLDNFRLEPGNRLGLFNVFYVSEKEVVLGEDDKHLNFRVSLILNNHQSKAHSKTLTISTTVFYNNFLGRLYFIPVRPFHKLIVSTMMRSTIKNLEQA
ncbi:MAG: DUF2867 domain-containing protein [Saprospiraceae bacterium]